MGHKLLHLPWHNIFQDLVYSLFRLFHKKQSYSEYSICKYLHRLRTYHWQMMSCLISHYPGNAQEHPTYNNGLYLLIVRKKCIQMLLHRCSRTFLKVALLVPKWQWLNLSTALELSWKEMGIHQVTLILQVQRNLQARSDKSSGRKKKRLKARGRHFSALLVISSTKQLF